MTFKTWLQQQEKVAAEAITDTGQVAHFQRVTIPGNTRMFPEPVLLDDKEKKKKKIRELYDQLEDAIENGDTAKSVELKKQLEECGMHFFKWNII